MDRLPRVPRIPQRFNAGCCPTRAPAHPRLRPTPRTHPTRPHPTTFFFCTPALPNFPALQPTYLPRAYLPDVLPYNPQPTAHHHTRRPGRYLPWSAPPPPSTGCDRSPLHFTPHTFTAHAHGWFPFHCGEIRRFGTVNIWWLHRCPDYIPVVRFRRLVTRSNMTPAAHLGSTVVLMAPTPSARHYLFLHLYVCH